MISKIYNSWQILKGNLWFFPAFISFIYLCMTFGIYHIESVHFQDVELPSVLFNGSAEDAKSLAIALLSSMITMATLAISITMVVLSLAATQLGPRLIRTFMSDGKTKVFIALFFGAVIACFVLTMILHDATPKDYTPRITITAVFTMCFANLFVLLAFVHHVAQSGIADHVILHVADDLNESLERLTIKENEVKEEENIDVSVWPKDFEKKRQSLFFERSGYVQHINYKSLSHIAAKHGLYIQIKFKAGHFLVQGEDGVRIYPKNKFNEDVVSEVRDCFIIGSARTPTQDIEYSIRHLVEIGLRALSPGINDHFTAIRVLDHLSAALAILFEKNIPSQWKTDSDGHVRIQAKQSDEADVILSAFDRIRYAGRDKPDIVEHLLKKLKILTALAHTRPQIEGLKRQLNEIERSLSDLGKVILDTDRLKQMCSELQKNLEDKTV